MSNTAVPQVPKELRYGIAQQAVLGTAVIDAAAVIELDCEPFEMKYGVKEYDANGSFGKRHMSDSDVVTTTNGVMPSCTIAGIANKGLLDHLIYTFCQQVTETQTGTAKKIFTIHDSQPDLIAMNAITDVGILETIFIRDPVSSKSVKALDMLCKSLTLTWNKGDPLRYSAEMIGIGVPSFSSNPSGTWSRVTAGDHFYFSDIDTVAIDGTAYYLESFEITLSQDVEGVGTNGSGSFQNLGLTNKTATCKMKVVKDADFEALLTAWTGNTAIDIDVKIGDGTADGDLTFDVRGKAIADTGVQKVYDALMNGEVNLKLLESSGGVAPVTINLANSNVRTWGTT